MARRIIGAAFVSLDGVMQAPGGPEEDPRGGFEHGGWMAAMFEEAIGDQVDTYLRPPFDLLLGRRTWEIFAAHWPYQPAEDPIAAMFAQNRKYVLTRSDRRLDWQGSHRLANIDGVAELKAGEGPDLVIQGSSTIYPELFARGLIDRLILITVPIVLGQGKRLFGEGTSASRFRPVEHRITPGGAVMATLEPAGRVETASFASPQPSNAELIRRASIEAGDW